MDQKRPAVGESTEEQNSFRDEFANVASPEKDLPSRKKQKHCEEIDTSHDKRGVEVDGKLEAAPKQAEVVTADSVMGLSQYPFKTNREIMLNHYNFVRHARYNRYRATSKLRSFLEWAATEEGKQLSRLGFQATEKFHFGQHRDMTFHHIARVDPTYHIRYQEKLNQDGKALMDGTLADYIKWFQATQKYRKRETQNDTRRSESSSLTDRRGIERFGFGQHRGKSFREIADEDPSYHLRYKAMDDSPNPVLDRYIQWFNRHGPGPHAAHRGLRAEMMLAAGMYPGFLLEED